ncbi:hypothetical protein K438DRAFT_2015209 [Mycena galopus ATCC 62051]|nr:hypothetical protein K438DRAFT_2015209 [Mycena galopus ATCC 62051]
MLTVMGVVIGFVMSCRTMSGMGRTAWTNVIRNARTMLRLIWYHVPIRLTPLVPSTPKDMRSTQEMAKVMVEKYIAVDLTEAYSYNVFIVRFPLNTRTMQVCGIIEAPPAWRSGDLLPGLVPRPPVASTIPAQPVAVSTAPPPSSSAASTPAPSTLAPTSLSA